MSDTQDDFEPIPVFEEDGDADLRPGTDDCYKCATCDTSCPVAEVDDEFPGPKFQGPEQWRLKRKGDVDIDSSIMDCSNCMRCDSACPSDVPLSEMHNRARATYVEEEVPTLSRKYLRAKLLSNYGRLGALASKVPRLANLVMGNRAVRWINERLLGITAEREFPAFATETFHEWWDERGGDDASRALARKARTERGEDVDAEKRVAYFHGDYANYNTPEVAKALVRVFESFGYEVAVPDQRCSGTPMFANGMLDDARRAARVNVETFAGLIEEGYDVVCSCTSCSMALRTEYPELFEFPDAADVEDPVEHVAVNTWDAVEYLRVHEDLDGALAGAEADFDDMAYHAPCHARNQGLAGQALEVVDPIEGVDAHDVGEEMFEHMEDADAEAGLTECPTCAMQMEHGTGYDVRHPLELLEAGLVDD